jgi:hypothetical protein
LQRELLRCVTAADCWAARRVCPRRGFDTPAWQGYFKGRNAALLPLLTKALARWAVLDCIPAHWIPVVRVQAGLDARFSGRGQPQIAAATLVPPVLGGADWVRNDGTGEADGVAALEQMVQASQTPGSAAAVAAAVLQWPERTAAAVVVAAGGRLLAHGAAFDATGLPFETAELTSALVVPRAPVPPSWFDRCLAAVGLEELAWRVRRAWRARHGGNGLAPL